MSKTASAWLGIIAPQFDSDPDRNDFLQLARDRTSTCFYGDNTELAVAYRAAHELVMRDRGISTVIGGSSGEIASKREGDLAISFHKGNVSSKGDADLSLTSYGVQLIGLRAGSGAFIGVTGGLDDGCGIC